MTFRGNIICIAAFACLGGAATALGYDHPQDGLVVFVNSSSTAVTVSVDGEIVCSIEPGDSCSTVLGGTDPDVEHLVHGDMGSNSWDDKIKISECHWNWNGTKTFTFTDEHVPFECKQ